MEIEQQKKRTRMRDITGMRSGKLVAVEKTDIKKNSSYMWRCKCDCGKEVLLEAYRITGGHVKSCGCGRKLKLAKDLTGQRFGRLVAVRRLDEKQNSCYFWLCKCDCGRYTKVSTNRLMSDVVHSCGCLVVENARNNNENGKSIADNSHYIDGTCVERILSITKPARNNTSGCVGVCQKQGKWLARITFKGKVYYLGCYDDFAKAVEVRKKAEQKLFGEFLEWYQNFYDPEKRRIEV